MKPSVKLAIGLVFVAAAAVGGYFLVFCKGGPTLVLQPAEGLPITAFNLTFRVGSVDDPKGSEGLAYLTGRMIREGGVKAWGNLPARSRAELEEFLFPLASEIGVSVAKEQTSLSVTTADANAGTVYDVISQLLLAPAFQANEFERIKAETLDLLAKQFPREDQEELGKAALDQAIYGKAHPYGHVVQGTVEGVNNVTLDQVMRFYAAQFTQANLTLGAAGVIAKDLDGKLRANLKALPRGSTKTAAIPEAPVPASQKLTIVEGPFESTGVHLGQVLPTRRGQEDFANLYLAATAFGKHRSFVGRLMKEVREIRGLNYGTYSYVEDYPYGGQVLIEPLNVARTRQAFTVWARPTTLPNGCFLLKQVLSEVKSLAEKGLTPEEFKLGQSHLIGYVPLLGVGLDRTLGYAIDSKFYGINGDYLADLQKAVETTSREKVAETLQRHLRPATIHIVVVTPSAAKFQEALQAESCPITYPPGIQKPDEVLARDKEIAGFPVHLNKGDISVVSSESVFGN